MKIVHVITTLGVGGAEKHLAMLAGGQIERGHSVHVAYLKGAGELSADFEALGAGVTHFPMDSLLSSPRAIGALARWLRGVQPDIVHTHLLKADAVGTLAARRAGIAAIVSSKHNDERALLFWPVRVIHGWLARSMRRTIALSDHVARFAVRNGKISPERVRRIYYGVDPAAMQPQQDRATVRRELGLGQDARVLICVGRLAPQKDHPTLLAALQLLPDDVVLLVVGGDPFGAGREKLVAVAEELEIDHRTHFLGIRDDVPDLLGAADVFVLPSLWEGLGLVFLEAMAVGLPVVATRISAVPEVVQDGETGWLVPAADPTSLATATLAALEDPEERRRRGEAGRARLAQRFGLARMLDETLAVYAEVLAEVGDAER